MSNADKKPLLLSDLAEEPEAASETAPKQETDPEEADHCFKFLQAGQFSEAAKRGARDQFSKPAFIAALQRKRLLDASKNDEE